MDEKPLKYVWKYGRINEKIFILNIEIWTKILKNIDIQYLKKKLKYSRKNAFI